MPSQNNVPIPAILTLAVALPLLPGYDRAEPPGAAPLTSTGAPPSPPADPTPGHLKMLQILADIRDESAEDIRMIIEPRSKNVDPNVLMGMLFRNSDLEVRFSLNMNVLIDGVTPKVCSLKEVLRAFLDFRRDVLCRRARHRMAKIDNRLEVLEGLIIAFLNLDRVIDIIRYDDDPKAALMYEDWSRSHQSTIPRAMNEAGYRNLMVLVSTEPGTGHRGLSMVIIDKDTPGFSVGRHELKLGIRIGTEFPEGVGQDRIANAVAAFQAYDSPLIVIDCGTATTLDVINREGVFEGGLICPGMLISAEALYARAAQLFQINLDPPERLIGRNTTESMQSGIFYGYSCMIETLVKRISKECYDRDQTEPNVVITGGLAPKIAGELPEAMYDENLTLKGLSFIHEFNQIQQREGSSL
mgnify:CR=1 FL=1